jgi:hypothetical protein
MRRDREVDAARPVWVQSKKESNGPVPPGWLVMVAQRHSWEQAPERRRNVEHGNPAASAVSGPDGIPAAHQQWKQRPQRETTRGYEMTWHAGLTSETRPKQLLASCEPAAAESGGNSTQWRTETRASIHSSPRSPREAGRTPSVRSKKAVQRRAPRKTQSPALDTQRIRLIKGPDSKG